MYRSFRALQRADLGFDASGVLTAEIAMPYRGYETYARTEGLWRTLLERIRAVPGVESAGAVSGLPLAPEPAYYDLAIDVEESAEMHAGMTAYHVAPGYFDAMRIPVVEGQGVENGTSRAEAPVILSAAAARRLFPNGSAIGERIRRTAGPGPWWTVAAVVGDVPDERIGRRTQEIGLRVALGARAPDVERMVLADAARTIAIGLGLGLVAALAVGRVLASLLYGVSPTDLTSFAAVSLLLVLTATVATWLPARRAARISPTEALRMR